MSETASDAALEAARQHYERREWSEAIARYEAVGGLPALHVEDAERLAWSRLWTLAPASECLDAFEQLEASAMRAGDKRRAVRACLEQARIHSMLHHSVVAAASWARAVELLGDDADCAESAMTQVLAALELSDKDPVEAIELAEAALACARRVGDVTSEALAIFTIGACGITIGEDVEGAVGMVDRSMRLATSGSVHPMYAGIITCGVVMTCRITGDWRRAREWNEVADRFCARESICHYPGHCSVFRSELTRVSGDFEAAADRALAALEQAGDWSLTWTGLAYQQLGEAELCRGRLDEAELAFARSVEHGYDPQPGQALLLMARGHAGAALRAIRRKLDGIDTYAQADATDVLSAGVGIAIASGEPDTAAEWRDALEKLADQYRTPAVRAAATQAAGEVAAAEGRHAEAADALREAVGRWRGVDAPYHAARARVLLARSLDAMDHPAEADLERRTAAAAFDRLGATLDIAALTLPPPDADLQSRERRTFSFTDIVGSSQLVEVMGDDAWSQVLAVHDRHLRELMAAFGGEEVKHEGDGFFVAFDSEAAAVEWAVAVQRRLADHRQQHGFAPNIRIGIHCGEAVRYGEDYVGRCVHETARIAAAAAGDEILVGASAAAALGTGIEVAETRTVDLKGFAEPQQVVSIAW